MSKRSNRSRLVPYAVLLIVLLAAAIAQAEVVQKSNLRVNFEGKITPNKLPRSSDAPVRVAVSAEVSSTSEKAPPPLRQMTIKINRYGHLTRQGMPVCRLDQIQPATTADALAVCRRSLVGEGKFLAEVLLKGQAPFPKNGKIYAFNGELDGKPAILAHVYGTQPAPASYTIPFVISQSQGTFGLTLKAALPHVNEGAGYITGIFLDLGKTFRANGKTQAYLSASCPAPGRLSGATFSFAEAGVSFSNGQTLHSKLTRSCKVR